MTPFSDEHPDGTGLRRGDGAGALVAHRPRRAVGYRQPREGQRVAEIDESEVLATVGANILERRTEVGFSQRDLAAAAGVDRAFLARVEQGLRNPSVVLLAKVAQAMETTVSALTREI
jgi:DNA-binding XRE family transcriptional regulator